MPKIGEIKNSRQLGFKVKGRHIWSACIDCGKERWVKFQKGQPVNLRCVSCARKNKECREKVSKALSRSNSYRWNGGQKTTKQGYKMIRLYPEDFFYPMAQIGGYVFEHRLVVAKALGRCLQPWEIVHHKGIRYSDIRNKSDNLEDNLELSTNGAHSLAHNKGYRDGYQKGLHNGHEARIKELESRVTLLEAENVALSGNRFSVGL